MRNGEPLTSSQARATVFLTRSKPQFGPSDRAARILSSYGSTPDGSHHRARVVGGHTGRPGAWGWLLGGPRAATCRFTSLQVCDCRQGGSDHLTTAVCVATSPRLMFPSCSPSTAGLGAARCASVRPLGPRVGHALAHCRWDVDQPPALERAAGHISICKEMDQTSAIFRSGIFARSNPTCVGPLTSCLLPVFCNNVTCAVPRLTSCLLPVFSNNVTCAVPRLTSCLLPVFSNSVTCAVPRGIRFGVLV